MALAVRRSLAAVLTVGLYPYSASRRIRLLLRICFAWTLHRDRVVDSLEARASYKPPAIRVLRA